MKTIIARFEDMKKDPMAILEDGVSANKVEAALATIGIALRDSEGEFRALQDVMDELGMKWESLTRNQQAYIATVAAGSRQQSRFLAMMNNYDRTLDLIAESQNSAGAAAKQYAIYQDSIAAAQARLAASWEKFYSKIVDNNLIKTAINGLSKLVDAFSHVPPAITAIGTAIGALELQNFLSDRGGLMKILGNLLGNNGISGKKIGKKFIEDFVTTSFSELEKQSPTIIGGFKTIGSGIGGALTSITSGFFGVGKAIAAFVAANLEVIAIIGGVALVIGGLTKLINAQKIAYENNIKEIKKLTEEAEEYSSRSNNGADLFKTYNELSSKISLTNEEQTELNNTIKQISEIYPEAITYLDEYGNMQIANAEQIRDTIEAERQLAQERKKTALEKRGEVLEKSEEQWTKEGFEEVGINNRLSSAYFTNRDLIKQYENTKENGISELFRFTLEELEHYKQVSEEDYKEIIDNLNLINKQYKLNLNNLKNTASPEEVFKYYEAIANYDYDKVIKTLKDTNEKIKKNIIKENNIQLSFANLKFDENSSVATSQRVLASQIQAMFEKMDIDVWESFFGEEGNPEEFAKKIQEIIDVVSKDNALELTQLFKDFNAGKISVEEFRAKFAEIAELAEQGGVDSAIAFANSFGEQLENQLDKEKEKFLNYFEQKGVTAETRTNAAVQLSNGQGQIYQDYDKNYLQYTYQSEKLLQIPIEQLQQFEQQVKEAVEKGDASALANIQTQWLKTWGKIDKEVANLLVNGRIVDAFHQFSRDYVTEIANVASSLFGKKDYSSIDVSEGVNYYNTFDEGNGKNSFWDHVTIGDDGKLQLDAYAQLKVAQEDINKTVQEYNDKIIDAKAEIATNTELTEEQKEELQKCINYWEEAIKKGRRASDNIQIVIEQTKELSDLTSDWATTLEEVVNSSSENAKALQASSDAAKEYEEVIDVVEKLEEDIKDIGHISRENMDALIAHGDFYQDFFTIDEETGIIQLNNMVENYANAADAIKTIARNRQEFELEMKRQEIEAEAKKARDQADAYDILAQVFYDYAEEINDADEQMTQEQREQAAQRHMDKVTEAKKGLEAADTNYNALMQACEDTYRWMSTLDAEYWANIGKDGITTIVENQIAARKVANAAAKASAGDIVKMFTDITTVSDAKKQGDQFKSMADSLRAYADSLEASEDRLKIIDPTVYNELADKMKKTGKAGKEAMDKIEKAAEKVLDSLKDLDDLLIEIQKNLKEITVDYNPFTDLFEAWEHEWDYYYNIKNLITQLGKQGEYIDNIISSEYTSATEKLAAYDAKIGNITSKMAANDAYMTTLRAGIAQQALKLEKEFGKYYNVDNVMGNWQIFQKDTTLTEWNQVHDSIAKASYELSKLINHQENELNLLEATQDALEQERSAYESILSTVDSVIDSLKDNEEISVDLSGLKDLKAELELSIKNESVEEIKSEIRALNDYMQELEWQLDLNDNVVLDGIDKAFDRMENGVDHVQELIDALNDTISEQQQLLQEVSEIYNYYVETAISTEQELYNAIVENYQNEINEKKKQYDYLKQLDNDYLNSIKKNISDERKAREDANKQKSYQQNLQRAQLLQMDTSGAYRGELANLNKELENQRQDLYDDLVDKQVDALEKEIQKRHELYDMEVAALEERLAYYQENAIILWEMVNQIVAEGSESMMATLENTIEYINSNELAKEQQRRQWELSIQTTFKGVVNGEIENLKTRIEKGNEYIKSIEEIKAAINKNTEVYQQSTTLLTEENANFQSVMDAYMQTWTDMTNGLTGYYTNWQATVAAVKDAMEIDIAKLRALGENGGGIQELEETLRKSAKDMYDSFIEERRSYKDQLEGIIEDIRVRITAAITDAANAIRNAVNGVNDNPNGGSSRAGIGSGGSYASGGGIGSGTGGSGSKSESGWKWRAWASYYDLQSNPHVDEVVGDYDTQQEALAAIENLKRKWRTSWVGSSVAQVWNKYAKGGFVNYTGPAWLDGTPSKPEAVLNPKQTRLFETMVSSLERTANNSNVNSPLGSSYNIGDINTSIQVAKLDDQTDIDKLARKVEDKIVKTIRNRVVVSM